MPRSLIVTGLFLSALFAFTLSANELAPQASYQVCYVCSLTPPGPYADIHYDICGPSREDVEKQCQRHCSFGSVGPYNCRLISDPIDVYSGRCSFINGVNHKKTASYLSARSVQELQDKCDQICVQQPGAPKNQDCELTIN